MTFSEYYHSKTVLIETVKKTLNFVKSHQFTKYASVPFYKDGEKCVVKLKNGLLFETRWKQLTTDLQKVDKIIIEGEEYYPYWNNDKMISWLAHNSLEIY